MSLLKNSKPKRHILFFVLIILILSIAFYLDNRSLKVNRHIENKASRLLRLMECDETAGYSKEWEILLVDIYQGTNDAGDEYVSCSIMANDLLSNNSRSNNVYLFYGIVTTDQGNIIDKDLSMPDIKASREFSLNFVETGDSRRSLCVKNEVEYSCMVIVQYKGAILTFRFIMPERISKGDILSFINKKLLFLDKKIQEEGLS